MDRHKYLRTALLRLGLVIGLVFFSCWSAAPWMGPAAAQEECWTTAYVYSTYGNGEPLERSVYGVPGERLRVDLLIWYQLGDQFPDSSTNPTLVMFTAYQDPSRELRLVSSGELIQSGETLCNPSGGAYSGFCLTFFSLPESNDKPITIDAPESSFLFGVPASVPSDYYGYVGFAIWSYPPGSSGFSDRHAAEGAALWVIPAADCGGSALESAPTHTPTSTPPTVPITEARVQLTVEELAGGEVRITVDAGAAAGGYPYFVLRDTESEGGYFADQPLAVGPHAQTIYGGVLDEKGWDQFTIDMSTELSEFAGIYEYHFQAIVLTEPPSLSNGAKLAPGPIKETTPTYTPTPTSTPSTVPVTEAPPTPTPTSTPSAVPVTEAPPTPTPTSTPSAVPGIEITPTLTPTPPRVPEEGRPFPWGTILKLLIIVLVPPGLWFLRPWIKERLRQLFKKELTQEELGKLIEIEGEEKLEKPIIIEKELPQKAPEEPEEKEQKDDLPLDVILRLKWVSNPQATKEKGQWITWIGPIIKEGPERKPKFPASNLRLEFEIRDRYKDKKSAGLDRESIKLTASFLFHGLKPGTNLCDRRYIKRRGEPPAKLKFVNMESDTKTLVRGWFMLDEWLKPGKHTITLTASDEAGNSKTIPLVFTTTSLDLALELVWPKKKEPAAKKKVQVTEWRDGKTWKIPKTPPTFPGSGHQLSFVIKEKAKPPRSAKLDLKSLKLTADFPYCGFDPDTNLLDPKIRQRLKPYLKITSESDQLVKGSLFIDEVLKSKQHKFTLTAADESGNEGRIVLAFTTAGPTLALVDQHKKLLETVMPIKEQSAKGSVDAYSDHLFKIQVVDPPEDESTKGLPLIVDLECFAPDGEKDVPLWWQGNVKLERDPSSNRLYSKGRVAYIDEPDVTLAKEPPEWAIKARPGSKIRATLYRADNSWIPEKINRIIRGLKDDGTGPKVEAMVECLVAFPQLRIEQATIRVNDLGMVEGVHMHRMIFNLSFIAEHTKMPEMMSMTAQDMALKVFADAEEVGDQKGKATFKFKTGLSLDQFSNRIFTISSEFPTGEIIPVGIFKFESCWFEDTKISVGGETASLHQINPVNAYADTRKDSEHSDLDTVVKFTPVNGERCWVQMQGRVDKRKFSSSRKGYPLPKPDREKPTPPTPCVYEWNPGNVKLVNQRGALTLDMEISSRISVFDPEKKWRKMQDGWFIYHVNRVIPIKPHINRVACRSVALIHDEGERTPLPADESIIERIAKTEIMVPKGAAAELELEAFANSFSGEEYPAVKDVVLICTLRTDESYDEDIEFLVKAQLAGGDRVTTSTGEGGRVPLGFKEAKQKIETTTSGGGIAVVYLSIPKGASWTTLLIKPTKPKKSKRPEESKACEIKISPDDKFELPEGFVLVDKDGQILKRIIRTSDKESHDDFAFFVQYILPAKPEAIGKLGGYAPKNYTPVKVKRIWTYFAVDKNKKTKKKPNEFKNYYGVELLPHGKSERVFRSKRKFCVCKAMRKIEEQEKVKAELNEWVITPVQSRYSSGEVEIIDKAGVSHEECLKVARTPYKPTMAKVVAGVAKLVSLDGTIWQGKKLKGLKNQIEVTFTIQAPKALKVDQIHLLLYQGADEQPQEIDARKVSLEVPKEITSRSQTTIEAIASHTWDAGSEKGPALGLKKPIRACIKVTTSQNLSFQSEWQTVHFSKPPIPKFNPSPSVTIPSPSFNPLLRRTSEGLPKSAIEVKFGHEKRDYELVVTFIDLPDGDGDPKREQSLSLARKDYEQAWELWYDVIAKTVLTAREWKDVHNYWKYKDRKGYEYEELMHMYREGVLAKVPHLMELPDKLPGRRKVHVDVHTRPAIRPRFSLLVRHRTTFRVQPRIDLVKVKRLAVKQTFEYTTVTRGRVKRTESFVWTPSRRGSLAKWDWNSLAPPSRFAAWERGVSRSEAQKEDSMIRFPDFHGTTPFEYVGVYDLRPGTVLYLEITLASDNKPLARALPFQASFTDTNAKDTPTFLRYDPKLGLAELGPTVTCRTEQRDKECVLGFYFKLPSAPHTTTLRTRAATPQGEPADWISVATLGVPAIYTKIDTVIAPWDLTVGTETVVRALIPPKERDKKIEWFIHDLGRTNIERVRRRKKPVSGPEVVVGLKGKFVDTNLDLYSRKFRPDELWTFLTASSANYVTVPVRVRSPAPGECTPGGWRIKAKFEAVSLGAIVFAGGIGYMEWSAVCDCTTPNPTKIKGTGYILYGGFTTPSSIPVAVKGATWTGYIHGPKSARTVSGLYAGYYGGGGLCSFLGTDLIDVWKLATLMHAKPTELVMTPPTESVGKRAGRWWRTEVKKAVSPKVLIPSVIRLLIETGKTKGGLDTFRTVVNSAGGDTVRLVSSVIPSASHSLILIYLSVHD